MRIYIIGNDGITLCREPPATIEKGEIAVASREELHAARLSGKRLLALWNALPGIERLTKVGDRSMLIDRLWPAIEALPDPDQQSDTKRPSKQHAVIAMLQRPEGATVDEVATAMGWQRHTVRGLFSGALKKKLGLTLASAKEERGRDVDDEADKRQHVRRNAGERQATYNAVEQPATSIAKGAGPGGHCQSSLLLLGVCRSFILLVFAGIIVDGGQLEHFEFALSIRSHNRGDVSHSLAHEATADGRSC